MPLCGFSCPFWSTKITFEFCMYTYLFFWWSRIFGKLAYKHTFFTSNKYFISIFYQFHGKSKPIWLCRKNKLNLFNWIKQRNINSIKTSKKKQPFILAKHFHWMDSNGIESTASIGDSRFNQVSILKELQNFLYQLQTFKKRKSSFKGFTFF